MLYHAKTWCKSKHIFYNTKEIYSKIEKKASYFPIPCMNIILNENILFDFLLKLKINVL